MIGEPTKYARQAYDLTHDRSFWAYANATNVPEAAAYLAKECGVEALRFLDQDSNAVARFQIIKDAWIKDAWSKQNV